MFRTSDIVLIAVMVCAAAFTYKTKHQAENKLNEIGRLERQIMLERDTMTVLKADWSLLTQPARLQQLTELYQAELQLEPVGPQQFVELEDLPVRELDVEELSVESLAGSAGSGRDPIVTGGVAQ